MKKKAVIAFGKMNYLLGADKDGIQYWLQQASWDCDWYWGYGYVETYTNNQHPERSNDIQSHQHFDGLFFNTGKNGFDAFKDFFVETPLTNEEIWKLMELMKTFYTAKEWAEVCYRGGSHYTSNPCKDRLKCNAEYDRINKQLIPEISLQVAKILDPFLADIPETNASTNNKQ